MRLAEASFDERWGGEYTARMERRPLAKRKK